MSKITPFLCYNNDLQEVVDFYSSIFKDMKVSEITRMGENSGIFSATFQIEGQEFYALNGGPHFKFSEAVSIFVSCSTQEEVDEYWEKLSAGGEKSQCGWLKDKFGLSWQIIPRILGELLRDKDRTKAQKVMQSMMQMSKIDIAALKKAYES
ncbi:VOC family protein [Leptospira langatensis]|uniref:VOC family protein n=1 Tax=Leptospira langatensis TaxID=2484983 RepID=A0A5F1ZPN5_9LEPT|nr:VOC family protein [Leptospira langatensis]TGK05485.1 VOC family protein [Leptospira langatensis]TGL38621.1 VOC family protein [Leptospira langatensis]